MLHTITLKVSFSDAGLTAQDMERVLDAIAEAGRTLQAEVAKDTDTASVYVSRPRATEAAIARLHCVG
jgi:hypothetical protein